MYHLRAWADGVKVADRTQDAISLVKMETGKGKISDLEKQKRKPLRVHPGIKITPGIRITASHSEGGGGGDEG